MTPLSEGDGEMEFAAYLTCIDNRDYDGLTVDGLLGLIGEPPPYYAFLVDAATVRTPEHPIVAVYTGPDEPERPRGEDISRHPGGNVECGEQSDDCEHGLRVVRRQH